MAHNESNINWSIKRTPEGNVAHDDARLAVLMDIRAELKRLNTLLHCENFQGMPRDLGRVAREVATMRRQNANRRKRR